MNLLSDEESLNENSFASVVESSDSEIDCLDVNIPCEGDNNLAYYTSASNEKWNKENLRTNGTSNAISFKPGPKNKAILAKTYLETFNLFFDSNIIKQLLIYSNKKKAVEEQELKAFLGMLLLLGVFKSNYQNLKDIYSETFGVPIFKMAFAKNRFQEILRCLSFDDKESRSLRTAFDNAAAFRDILDIFNHNLLSNYELNTYITLDEILPCFNGRCPFRVYMPNKPNKYGLKIYAVADSSNNYVSNMELYAGLQPEGPFKLSNKPEDIVLRLIEPYFGSHRNVTMDNYFMSLPLAKKLLYNGITCIGTLRKNKPYIPRSFFKSKTIDSTTYGFQNDATLLSYIPKKNKCVLLLSTMHFSNFSEKGKPEMIATYNKTKAGVNGVDQIISHYNVSRRTRKWTFCLFYTILNISVINAHVIYKDNQSSKITRSDFIKNLAMDLIKPYMEKRQNTQSLRRSIRHNITQILGPHTEKVFESNAPRRRCLFCKNNSNKYKNACYTCNAPVCPNHSILNCIECFKRNE